MASALDMFRRRQARYRAVFGSEDGQWVLRDISRRGYIGREVYAGDPLDTARNAGMRRLALMILKAIDENEAAMARRLEESDDGIESNENFYSGG